MRRVAALMLFFNSVAITSLSTAQQLDSVASTFSAKLRMTSKAIAVVDFTDLQGEVTELGRYLAEELSVALAGGAQGFTVIDRTHLKAILQEHKLASTGVIDPQTARQLGKVAGVDTLVTGTLTPFGDSVRLSVKALDTQTAAMRAAMTSDIPRTKAVDELLARSVGVAQPGPSSQSPSAPPQHQVQGAGVTLELQSCSKTGTCRLIALSDDDTRIRFYPAPKAWDDTGNEYGADSIRVGNQEWSGQLIAGVRTPVTFTFQFSGSNTSGFGGGGLGARLGSRSAASSPRTLPNSLSAIEVGIDTGAGHATLRFRSIAVK
jgi:TolB-like protein